MADETDIQRRLVAVFAADVEGYSRLMGADEVGTLNGLTERRAILDKAIADHRGRIANTAGDSVLAEFGSAVDAVRCAVEAQEALGEANASLPTDKRISFRIGIHVGDVMIRAGDLFGEGVNIAARLQTLAQAGGVCVSGATHEQVRKVLSVDFTDLGAQRVKNIEEPVRAFAIGATQAASVVIPSESKSLPLPDKPSIAVLPFQNMSGDPEQEYFADGIVEDIITALSRFKSIFVIARNSSFTYKGKAVDIKQVGLELGVRYVLEGSVRKSGNRIRVTGQLIEASTNRHIWADKFDGPLDDIFELQDRLTATVVGLIAPQIEDAEIARACQKSTASLDSYDFYLRGLALHYRQEWVGARELFKRAVELDPQFAAAYAMTAFTFQGQVGAHAQTLTSEMRDEALNFANQAALIGREDAFVLARCGHVLMFLGREFDRGATMVEKALSLNPNLAVARNSFGWISVVGCEPERAIENFQSMIRLSPLDILRVSAASGLAWAYWLSGRYADGCETAKSVITVYPYIQTFGSLIANCVAAGKLDEAKAAAIELLKLDPSLRTGRALVELFPLRKAEFRSKLGEALRAAGIPD